MAEAVVDTGVEAAEVTVVEAAAMVVVAAAGKSDHFLVKFSQLS
jgi:2-keto-3-deoxy-6-phosphogluconate aldolase